MEQHVLSYARMSSCKWGGIPLGIGYPQSGYGYEGVAVGGFLELPHGRELIKDPFILVIDGRSELLPNHFNPKQDNHAQEFVY